MFAMTVFPEALTVAAILFPLFSTISAAGSLADVEHVVLFMQGTDTNFTVFWIFR